MRRWKRAVRCLLFLAILTSEIGKAPVVSAVDGNRLTYAYSGDVGHLNPHLYGTPFVFQNMVYEPLLKCGENGQIVPWLAESWTESEDGKEYRFRLRKGVRFSDGTAFDAHAVKKNFDAVLMNRDMYRWLELINQIGETEVVDELTFRMVLKEYYYPALQELCLFRPLVFVSPAVFPESGNTAEGIKKPVGTGPWVLAEYKRDEYAVFKRNDDYWRKKPAIGEIRVKIIPDPESRALALESGEVDLIFGGGYVGGAVSMDTFMSLRRTGKYGSAISPPMAVRTIAMNTGRGPTVDPAVRRAIQHAVNKQSIANGVFFDTEKPADTLFARTALYCDIDLPTYEFSIGKSSAILDEAGWKLKPGGKSREKNREQLALDLSFVGTNPIHKALAEVIQGDLARVGIKVRLLGEEPQTFSNRWKTGEFHLTILETWGAPYDPHSLVSSMRFPTHADYQAQLGLPMKKEIDEKIARLLVMRDDKERRVLYDSVLRTLHEQSVYMPITFLASMVIHGKRVKGVHFGPTMYEIPFEDMELDETVAEKR